MIGGQSAILRIHMVDGAGNFRVRKARCLCGARQHHEGGGEQHRRYDLHSTGNRAQKHQSFLAAESGKVIYFVGVRTVLPLHAMVNWLSRRAGIVQDKSCRCCRAALTNEVGSS